MRDSAHWSSDMSDNKPAAQAPAAPAAKRGGKSLIIIIVAVVVLGGAGGGGFWWWRKSHAEAATVTPESKHASPTGVVPMEPFLVNLADKEASRFLRVTLRLVVDTEAEAKEIEETPVEITRARSAILEVLATQQSAALVTPEGKTELKKAIAEHTTAVLKKEVRDVLFTDFVVQF
jgi:flagellar protein FliL